MQIAFELPEKTKREVKALASHIGVSEESVMRVLAFVGFHNELYKLLAHEMPLAKTEPSAAPPIPIDWHKRDKPAPIDWPKGGRDQFD